MLVLVLLQAWKAFCSASASNCSHSVTPPQTAYIISLPEDSAKCKHLERSVKGLGLSIEVVDAIRSDQVLLELPQLNPAATTSWII